MKVLKKIAAILAGVFLIAFQANAQKGVGNMTGMANELEKPPIVSISGELDSIKVGPCEHTTGHAYIGTHLFLKSGDEILNIHLGASNAIDSFVTGLNIGDQVSVQAFQTEQMKEDNFIAKEVSVNGTSLVLRDENLRPFWAGKRSRF